MAHNTKRKGKRICYEQWIGFVLVFSFLSLIWSLFFLLFFFFSFLSLRTDAPGIFLFLYAGKHALLFNKVISAKLSKVPFDEPVAVCLGHRLASFTGCQEICVRISASPLHSALYLFQYLLPTWTVVINSNILLVNYGSMKPKSRIDQSAQVRFHATSSPSPHPESSVFPLTYKHLIIRSLAHASAVATMLKK